MLNFSTIRTLLFDMDGVIYRGKTRLPGVLEILQFCEARDIAYACITNNASKTPAQFKKKLNAMDIDIPAEQVFSSSLMTGQYLRGYYPRGTTAYVIGMDGLHEAMFADGYFVFQEQHPDLVVLGVDTHVTYEKFRIGALAIQSGARYIVTNEDRSFPAEDGMWPGAGALASVLHLTTGVDPLVIGKPQPAMFQAALERLYATPETTLVVGDRLETDIAGARSVGLRSALVLTGATRREQVEDSPHQPDGVFADLPDLLAAWKRQTG